MSGTALAPRPARRLNVTRAYRPYLRPATPPGSIKTPVSLLRGPAGPSGIAISYATRDQLVSAVAGGFVTDNGTVLGAGGYAYMWSSGAAVIPDLPNLVPQGQAFVQHFGAVGNGVADDTPAFNAAAIYSRLTYVPYSTGGYKVASTIEVTVGTYGSMFFFLGAVPSSQLVGTADYHMLKAIGFSSGVGYFEQARIIPVRNKLTGTNEGGKRGIFIQQFEPDLASTDYGTGLFKFNEINCTWAGTRVGAGGPGSTTSPKVHALQVSFGVGGAQYDTQSAKSVSIGLSHSGDDTSDGDKVGISSGISSAHSTLGKWYGGSFSYHFDAGASSPQAVGCEVDCTINEGASIDEAYGFNALSLGTAQATRQYAAYKISKSGSPTDKGWQVGLQIGRNGPEQGIDPSGSWFGVEAPVTLDSIFDCHNVTTTNYIFNFPTFQVNNIGRIYAGENIVFGAGWGCNFAAHANSAEPGVGLSTQIFNNYEYGTWTPYLTDGTHTVSPASTTTARGFYTRIGNLVSCVGDLAVSSLEAVTGSTVRVGGLPYASGGLIFSPAKVGNASGLALPAAGMVVAGNVPNGQMYIKLTLWNSTAGQVDLTPAQFSATGSISFEVTYFS